MTVIIEPVRRYNLRKARPALAAICLLALCQALFFQISEVAQDSVRQVVSLKRAWALDSGVIRRDAGKLLVFFMGGSRITGGIIPQVFDEETGLTHSYNVSLPGLPLATHYFWLKDYLSRHGRDDYPDYILLDPSDNEWTRPYFPHYALVNAGISEVFSYFAVTGDSGLLINYFLPIRFHWPEVRRYLQSRFYSSSPEFVQDRMADMYRQKYEQAGTYKRDWRYLFQSQFAAPEKHWLQRKSLIEETRGYYDFRELSARGGALPRNYRFSRAAAEVSAPPPGAATFLKKFLALTEKHGIKVVFIDDYAPRTEGRSPKVLKVLPAEGEDEAEKDPHVVVSPLAVKKKLYSPAAFSDPVHLSIRGAADFTKHVAGVFRSSVPEVGRTISALKEVDWKQYPE